MYTYKEAKTEHIYLLPERVDTEFGGFNMGMWKHKAHTPGFFWKVMADHQSSDATGDGKVCD